MEKRLEIVDDGRSRKQLVEALTEAHHTITLLEQQLQYWKWSRGFAQDIKNEMRADLEKIAAIARAWGLR